MDTMTIEDRVRRGADWHDMTYPGWWKSIDLGILNIANCHRCVLGQVYTGCIPEAEQGQILAQVIAAMPKYRVTTFVENMTEGDEGGYQVLLEHHELLGLSAGL